MAFGSMDGGNRQMPMSEINVVPLVDVMFVLLVILIITAPLLTHSVKVDLPKASSSPNITRPDHVEFALRDDASLYWNGEPVTMDQLAPGLPQRQTRIPISSCISALISMSSTSTWQGEVYRSKSRISTNWVCYRSDYTIVTSAAKKHSWGKRMSIPRIYDAYAYDVANATNTASAVRIIYGSSCSALRWRSLPACMVPFATTALGLGLMSWFIAKPMATRIHQTVPGERLTITATPDIDISLDADSSVTVSDAEPPQNRIAARQCLF